MLSEHFGTSRLEPVPVNASAGCTKLKKIKTDNKVPFTNRQTNQNKTWTSRLGRKYSG